MSPTWRQMRLLTGKGESTCGCTDRPKYWKCKTCPFFNGFVEGGKRWLESDQAKCLRETYDREA